MIDPLTYRVVQWTTGNVGKSSVRAIAANPTLELVGCYAWSPEKVGHDVGELCGIDPLDVKATNDVEPLLALKPDLSSTTPPPILTFGGGAHYCIGANLARVELAGALKILAPRMPNPRRVATSPWKPMLGLSGPLGLDIEFDPADT